MTKLLHTDVLQLLKNKAFHALMLVLPLFSAIMMVVIYFYTTNNVEYENATLDMFYFQLAPNLSTFFAIAISLFIGAQYGDGTLRNKIIIGHSRTNIYVSNLLTCILASFMLVIAWLLGSLVGIPFWGTLHMNALTFIKYLIICLFFSCSLSAIFVLVGMLLQNKSTSAVVSIVLSIVLTIFANRVCGNIQQPEYIDTIITNVHGIKVPVTCLNPRYIGGFKRVIGETILDVIPTGQARLMAELATSRPILQIFSSIILTIIISIIGILAFKKKDLE